MQVVEEETNEHPVGTVFRQNPEAGKVVDRTADIRLVIAKAVPEPTPPPQESDAGGHALANPQRHPELVRLRKFGPQGSPATT